MKKILTLLLAACFTTGFATDPTRTEYKVEIDLTKVEKDLLPVILYVPTVAEETVEFHMPAMVPGTYAVYNFGRFLQNVRALDAAGNELPLEKIGEDRWKISNATKLDRIEYLAEDTYDTKQKNKIFEPGGTSFEDDNFVLNNYSYVGYLNNYQNRKYTLEVTKPTGFFGTTGLESSSLAAEKDVFSAPSYFELHDSPIMYCLPDTAMIQVGNAMLTVGVYSPNKMLSADLVRENLQATLDAQRKYLGGTLPVSRYAILIYLTDKPTQSGGYGALEHSYSTLLVLPENEPNALAQAVRGVTAHEFFHIVTPLNIHSEHIHDYNFIEPSMSAHLWMYEGVTEYSAQHVQVKYDLYTYEEFFEEMRRKIITSRFFKQDLAFTDLSLGALGEHESQYANVYEKGAVIGMCLDLLLLEQSNGEYGIQALMKDLSKQYGKQKAFEDAKLFEIIEKLTYPEVGVFLREYVGGSKALPLVEYLGFAGVKYAEVEESMEPSFGVKLVNDLDGGMAVMGAAEATQLGESLGFKEGDVLKKFDEEEVTIENFKEVYAKVVKTKSEGDRITVTVSRYSNGKSKDKKLKAKVSFSRTERKDVIRLLDKPTDKQLKVRNAWLEG